MRQYLPFLLIPFLLIFWQGCDIIEAPYLDPEFIAQLPADEQCLLAAQQKPAFPDGQVIERVVLLEEMTGHQCGNCPEASDEAYRLISEAYPGRVILASIHAGSLSRTYVAGDKFRTDFTTPEGTEIFGELNDVGGVPYGMINRKVKTNDFESWENSLIQALNETPEAGLRVFTCYDPDSLSVGVVVDVKFLAGMEGDKRLSVYLVEDKVIDWQKDYRNSGSDVDVPDYTHHDVVRKVVNGTWGEPLFDTSITAGEVVTKGYTVKLEESYDPTQCKIVAFLHDFETKEVLQAGVISVQ